MQGWDLDTFIRAVLSEDLGERGDVTSEATISADAVAAGHVVARESGSISGIAVAARVFRALDTAVEVEPLVEDGASVPAGTRLLAVSGPARAILSAERVALNLLGHLSGVATATNALVREVAGTSARILDTRKTLPGLRLLQKQAVVHGGGANHRIGLYDAVLIKDNHIAVAGSVAGAVRLARTHVGATMDVEVEVERVSDVEPAIEAGANIILLDNMPTHAMQEAVAINRGRCLLEASGGITLESVRAVAETGVDRISVGWITHSAPSLDVALDFEVGSA